VIRSRYNSTSITINPIEKGFHNGNLKQSDLLLACSATQGKRNKRVHRLGRFTRDRALDFRLLYRSENPLRTWMDGLCLVHCTSSLHIIQPRFAGELNTVARHVGHMPNNRANHTALPLIFLSVVGRTRFNSRSSPRYLLT
jgi:hypothetical protein